MYGCGGNKVASFRSSGAGAGANQTEDGEATSSVGQHYYQHHHHHRHHADDPHHNHHSNDQVSMGPHHTCCLTDSGQILTFGLNTCGQVSL